MTLKGVPAGNYYVGIWYESSLDGLESPQDYAGRVFAYLNGRAIQFSTHTEPVQVAPGVYYVEAQSKVAEPLKDRDEIEILGAAWRPVRLARLTLHPQEAARGHGWIHENYGANMFHRESSLDPAALLRVPPRGGKEVYEDRYGNENRLRRLPSEDRRRQGLAYYQVANPLPVPLTVKCRTEVRAYFRELVGSELMTIELKPHERITRNCPSHS